MPLSKDIVTGGFSGGAAQAINGLSNLGVAAAGTTITDATELTRSHSNVSTVASGAGVKCSTQAEINDEQTIFNDQVTNALTVYPPQSTHQINQLAAGVGMLLAPYTGVRIKRVNSTRWVAWLSA